MNHKVLNTFPRLSDPALKAKADEIMVGLSGNPAYPSPIPDLATVQNFITGYGTALSNVKNGSAAIAIKDQKREELIATLLKLGDYVTYQAGDDYAAMVSSNFDISKKPEPAPPIPAPENFSLETGRNPGELQASLRSVRGAKAYMFQYATTDPALSNAVWHTRFSNGCKCTLTGLASGQRYWVRVVVLGSYAQEVYSDVLSRIAQ